MLMYQVIQGHDLKELVLLSDVILLGQVQDVETKKGKRVYSTKKIHVEFILPLKGLICEITQVGWFSSVTIEGAAHQFEFHHPDFPQVPKTKVRAPDSPEWCELIQKTVLVAPPCNEFYVARAPGEASPEEPRRHSAIGDYMSQRRQSTGETYSTLPSPSGGGGHDRYGLSLSLNSPRYGTSARNASNRQSIT